MWPYHGQKNYNGKHKIHKVQMSINFQQISNNSACIPTQRSGVSDRRADKKTIDHFNQK